MLILSALQGEALATGGRGVFVAALPEQPKALGWSWGTEQPSMRAVLPEKMRSLAMTADSLFLIGGKLLVCAVWLLWLRCLHSCLVCDSSV